MVHQMACEQHFITFTKDNLLLRPRTTSLRSGLETLVELLIRSRNSGSRTVQTLTITNTLHNYYFKILTFCSLELNSANLNIY